MLLVQPKEKVSGLFRGLPFLKLYHLTGMEVSINKQKHVIAGHTTLRALLNAQLGDKQKGVAVAINDAVIPRSDWDNHLIQLNDDILIIKATQGG